MGKSSLEKSSYFSWFRSDFYRHEDFYYWLTLFSLGFVLCACDALQRKPEKTAPPAPGGAKSFIQVPLSEKAVDVVASGDKTCAILATGKVSCWGNGNPKPQVTEDFDNVESVAMLPEITCIKTTAGDVRCWGTINGKAITSAESKAEPAPLVDKVTNIFGNYGRFCVTKNIKDVLCWGSIPVMPETIDNRFLNPALVAPTAPAPVKLVIEPLPKPVPLENKISEQAKDIANLEFNICALSRGHIQCLKGEVGNSTNEEREYLSISASYSHLCALQEKGKAVYCGKNQTNGDISTWLVKKGLPEGLVQLNMGGRHGCVLTEKGLTYCWGNNLYSQLGISSAAEYAQDGQLTELQGAKKLALGANHTCALMNDGKVSCWGRSDRGQTGAVPPTP